MELVAGVLGYSGREGVETRAPPLTAGHLDITFPLWFWFSGGKNKDRLADPRPRSTLPQRTHYSLLEGFLQALGGQGWAPAR